MRLIEIILEHFYQDNALSKDAPEIQLLFELKELFITRLVWVVGLM